MQTLLQYIIVHSYLLNRLTKCTQNTTSTDILVHSCFLFRWFEPIVWQMSLFCEMFVSFWRFYGGFYVFSQNNRTEIVLYTLKVISELCCSSLFTYLLHELIKRKPVQDLCVCSLSTHTYNIARVKNKISPIIFFSIWYMLLGKAYSTWKTWNNSKRNLFLLVVLLIVRWLR